MVKHLTMALLAMVIYGALHVPLGRIPVANGAGWDGIDYVAMLEKGWKAGGPNTQLRPLIVWLARPAYLVTGSPAQAFDVTNYVFTGLLAFLFSLLMERYGASSLARWVAIVCISASNAYRLPAYYPVLIDLGGHAMMALAVWHIIAGPRWAAGAASIAAVLSREYAPVVLIFGAWRDRRLHVPLKTTLATYGPSALIYVAVRLIVDARSPAEGNTLQTFIRNMSLWTGPLFPAFYVYFLLTIAGGVSLVLAAQPQRWWGVIRRGAGVARVCRADHARHGAGGHRHLAISHRVDAADRRALRALFAGVAAAPGHGAHVRRRRVDARDANAVSGNGPDAILYGVVSVLRLDQYGSR